jgi:hypothetical protein
MLIDIHVCVNEPKTGKFQVKHDAYSYIYSHIHVLYVYSIIIIIIANHKTYDVASVYYS